MIQRAYLDARAAVRRALAGLAGAGEGSRPLVLVALSGGADSLALAAAVASEAAGSGVRAGAVIVDHGLQDRSAEVAARAAAQARELGLDPVVVRAVEVGDPEPLAAEGRKSAPGEQASGHFLALRHFSGGPEAAAREARYGALVDVAAETGAIAVLTAHTRDDQAEQVLLALARGSGVRSLAGIPERRPLAGDGAVVLRPFLGERPAITRETTVGVCAELGLEPWADPHNSDPSFARVRVRERVLPVLERELGPGFSAALARTADIAAEDAAALDALAAAVAERAVAEAGSFEPPLGDVATGRDGIPRPAPIHASASVLAEQPAALRNRAIRLIAARGFDAYLTRERVLAIAALVADWRGQGPVYAPGIRVTRSRGSLAFEPQIGSPRG